MFGTLLSIVGGISDAVSLYRFGSTMVKGDDTNRVLNTLDAIKANVERLSDNILYAPDIQGLTEIDTALNRNVDLRTTRELLEPLQASLGETILSSGIVVTPDKMEKAMLTNPWNILQNIQPYELEITPPRDPNLVPILFEFRNMKYIGWQMRGSLPVLFDCEFHDLPGIGSVSMKSILRDTINQLDPEKKIEERAEQPDEISENELEETLEILKPAKTFHKEDVAQPEVRHVDASKIDYISRDVMKIVATTLEVEIGEVDANSRLIDDLNIDKPTRIDLIQIIEDEFFLAIPDEVAKDLATVHDLVQIVSDNILNR